MLEPYETRGRIARATETATSYINRHPLRARVVAGSFAVAHALAEFGAHAGMHTALAPAANAIVEKPWIQENIVGPIANAARPAIEGAANAIIEFAFHAPSGADVSNQVYEESRVVDTDTVRDFMNGQSQHEAEAQQNVNEACRATLPDFMC